ncbi:MAG: OB-fold nucleic acid binding domain-containing protein [Desulfobulbus sp.]
MASLRTFLTHTTLSLALLAPITALAAEQPTASPLTPAATSLQVPILQGKIAETMNSAGYTYLLLDTAQGQTWAAIPETRVELGQTVALQPGITMTDFSSKTLERTFPSIIFSPGLEGTKPGDGDTTAVPPTAEPATPTSFDAALSAERHGHGIADILPGDGRSPGSSGAVVPAAAISIDKAEGPNGYAVEECFAKAKELNGKTVLVRGKVMKISRMIMGKNWVHIQDGTGDAKANQHDLVVTTLAEPKEGSVVTVEGVLAADRDFGAGYTYAVLIEDATIKE